MLTPLRRAHIRSLVLWPKFVLLPFDLPDPGSNHGHLTVIIVLRTCALWHNDFFIVLFMILLMIVSFKLTSSFNP